MENENEKDTEFDTDDIQYDEEGNIIIPDADESDGDSDDADVVVEDKPDDAPSAEEKENTPSNNDDRIKELERLLSAEKEKTARYEKQGKAVFNKLGYEGETFEEALNKAGAEADDTTVEEYLKKQEEKSQDEEARQLLQRTKFEQLKKADLEALKKVFPDVEEVKNLDDLEKMENFKRFAELRDMDLTVEEAYRAANPKAIERKVVEATKQHSLNATKNHLQSNVPKGSKDTAVRMTAEEYETFKDIFPNMSKAEIYALYKQTKG